MKIWKFLAIEIVADAAATCALRSRAGFTKPWPNVFAAFGYALVP